MLKAEEETWEEKFEALHVLILSLVLFKAMIFEICLILSMFLRGMILSEFSSLLVLFVLQGILLATDVCSPKVLSIMSFASLYP